MQSRRVMRVAGLALWMLTSGCSDEAPAERLNVLLITVDTLRADHVTGYGYARNTTPNLDAFLATSVSFENAHANAPWTLPSLASLMTSLHPSAHGCVKFSSRLDPSHLTLAEISIVLGCSVPAAKQRSARAIERLRHAADWPDAQSATPGTRAIQKGGGE